MKHSLYALTLSLLLLFLAPVLRAQDGPCGQDLMEQTAAQRDPDYWTRRNDMDYRLSRQILSDRVNATRGQDTTIYTIPLVFHILHQNGPEKLEPSRLLNEIEYLNEAFRNIGYYNKGVGEDVRIQFCLAAVTPDGQATSGLDYVESPYTVLSLGSGDDFAMKQLFNWETTRYLNVYVAQDIQGGGGGSILGYAYFPANHGTIIDGLVLRASQVGLSRISSTTIIHEMGHYLGLYHPFQDGCDNYDCLLQGDRVCDTPPDQATYDNCTAPNNSCSTDADDPSPKNPFTTDVDDLNSVYMDYNFGACQSVFTAGQRERMRAVVTNLRSSLLQSQVCRGPFAADIGVISVNKPGYSVCNGSFDLEVEIKNYGVAPISKANISFQVDNGPVQTVAWQGLIPYTDTVVATIAGPQNLTPGPHKIKVFTGQPNLTEDRFHGNDSMETTLIFASEYGIPYTERFDQGIPSDWLVINPDGKTWDIYNTTTCNPTGGNSYSLHIDNSKYFDNGIYDGIVSPMIDLSNAVAATLEFDIAYPYDPRVSHAPEGLSLYISTDCGDSYDSDPLYDAERSSLASVIIDMDSVEFWKPESCTDWKTISIDLADYVGQKVLLRFDLNKYDNGFNFFLDNIKIEGTTVTDLEEDLQISSLSIYPNPANNTVNWAAVLGQSGNWQVSLLDVTGTELHSESVARQGEVSGSIETTGLAPGFYLLKISDGTHSQIQKLMISH